MRKILFITAIYLLTLMSACSSISATDLSKYEGMKLDKALYESLQNEDWSGMASLAKIAMKKFENDDIGYFYMGIAEHEYEHYNSALRYYNKALELATGEEKFDIYRNRGMTYYKLGKMDLAIKDYKKALKIKPDNEVLKEQLDYFEGKTKYFRIK